MNASPGWTEPRELPLIALWPNDEVRIHTDESGELWVQVIGVYPCLDDDHTQCLVVVYPATTDHLAATGTVTARLPVRTVAPIAQPGPAPSERVYVTTARAGIPMHRMQPDNRDATACGRATRTGITLVAAEARAHWSSEPCERCWPGATP